MPSIAPSASSSSPHQPALGIAVTPSNAIVSAEPQLRDLKRESTAFVPATVKRRKATATQQIKARINAAPGASENNDEDSEALVMGPQRPDLMATLRSAGVGMSVPQSAGNTKPKDDYDDFLADVGDILN